MNTQKIDEVIQQVSVLTPAEKIYLADYLIQQAQSESASLETKSVAENEKPDKRRLREHEWLQKHSAEYAGQWVVIDGDKLICHGKDGRKVLAQARQAGVQSPFLVLVPKGDELPFGGW